MTKNQIPQHNNLDAYLLRVPYENLSKCIGLRQCYKTSTYVWLPSLAIIDVVFISQAHVIQHSYRKFGGKGVDNSNFVYGYNRYSIDNSVEVELTSRTIHHSHFHSFAQPDSPLLSNFSPSFNTRIFTSLSIFRDSINKLMHTKRMIQRNGYCVTHFLSAECWNYLCAILKEYVCVRFWMGKWTGSEDCFYLTYPRRRRISIPIILLRSR